MDIYAEIGVRKVINAYGTVTPYGGSLLEPAVLAAMEEAARSFVDVSEMSATAGRSIARWLGFSDGLVVGGAAAGLSLATAAALCGSDAALGRRLPEFPGPRREILVHRSQHNGWTQAVRIAGATVVEFGSEHATSEADLLNALSDRVAAILYYADHALGESLTVEAVCRHARSAGIAVIVDAAACVPPLKELRRYEEWGATVTLVSGGKLLGGPASTGLALGSTGYVANMRLLASPNENLGRPMKVGKEDVAGLFRAVQLALSRDEDACIRTWKARALRLGQGLRLPPGLTWRCVDRGEDDVLPRLVPRIYIEWEPYTAGFDAETVAELLLRSEPSVAVAADGTTLRLNPMTLSDEDVPVVVDRLNEVLLRLMEEE